MLTLAVRRVMTALSSVNIVLYTNVYLRNATVYTKAVFQAVFVSTVCVAVTHDISLNKTCLEVFARLFE